MSKESQKFLEIEKNAERLLEVLKQLKDDAVSYQSSTKELHIVRENLVKMIGSLEGIAQDTKNAVLQIKEIGGPEILESIDRLSKDIKDNTLVQQKQKKEVKLFQIIIMIISVLVLVGIATLLLQ